jgi:hypothetical protein
MSTRLAHLRHVERIHLAQPVAGRIGGKQVVIRDVSLSGCRAEHDFTVKVGADIRIAFTWHGEEISLAARVLRCKLETFDSGITIYQSGHHFIENNDSTRRTLRKLIADELVHALEEQKANARGDTPRFLKRMAIFARSGHLTENPQDIGFLYESEIALPYYRVARERGYVRYTLTGFGWTRKRTHSPQQPDEGFTLWAHEDSEQVELLCASYAKGDSQTRWLIRTCAELSLVIDDSIPPQRFEL